jgi:hypothetical protein
MRSVRNVFSLVLAMVLVAFALPSVGAPQFTKQYSLSMTSTNPLEVVATLTNVSPDGNANIGSYKLTITGGKIASAVLTQQDPKKVGIVTVGDANTSVSVTGIQPLKPGAPAVKLKITLQDCGQQHPMECDCMD